MRIMLHVGLIGTLLLSSVHAAPAQVRDQRTVRIGIVVDGPWERNDEVHAGFEQELTDLLGGEFDVQFPPSALIVADWTLEGIRSALDRLFADPNVDIIVTLGVIASSEVSRRGPLPKPTIAPFVLDAYLEGIPETNGASGVRNLSYISYPDRFSRDLRAFVEAVQFRHLAVVANPRYLEALPGFGAAAQELADSLGIRITTVPLDRVVDEALAQIPADAEAVYLGALTHLQPGEFDRLVASLIERRLPSFSLFGTEEVRRGVLMGLNSEAQWTRTARRVALNAQRILLGEDASGIPVAFAREEQLTINMATARAIGAYPPWSVLTEATLIEEARIGLERQTSLASVAREASVVNLDLAAQERAVAAGEDVVRGARAPLLPQAELSGLMALIDEDRAEASFGTQAQRSLFGGGTVSWLLYNEPVWANLGIEGQLQNLRVAERDALELDVILDATIAYLNVLRGKTFERIQRDNLRVTRSNLDLARVRRTVGSAAAGEVFRWESEIASDRQEVIASNTQRNQAEIALNRVLHRPLEEPFDTEEATLDDVPLTAGDPNVLQYIGDQQAFRVFRAFMVEEALAASPELKQLDAVVGAQERALTSAKNAWWAPTIAVEGSLDYLFTEGGAGADFGSSLPPGSPAIPQPNDLRWSVGLRLSYPLFVGGARSAASAAASEDLARVRLERDALAERVEQRARSALHDFGASYASIQLAEDGARAARESLRLVTDAYARGAARLVDLLDAQNAALVAELAAANAVYDFLVDLMDVERAVGRFSVLMSDQEREAFFQRLDGAFAQAGITPRSR